MVHNYWNITIHNRIWKTIKGLALNKAALQLVLNFYLFFLSCWPVPLAALLVRLGAAGHNAKVWESRNFFLPVHYTTPLAWEKNTCAT